jgi:hypothetical protein
MLDNEKYRVLLENQDSVRVPVGGPTYTFSAWRLEAWGHGCSVVVDAKLRQKGSL